MNDTTYFGLVILSHCVKDAASKNAAINTLTDWQPENRTPREWIASPRGRTNNPALALLTQNQRDMDTRPDPQDKTRRRYRDRNSLVAINAFCDGRCR